MWYLAGGLGKPPTWGHMRRWKRKDLAKRSKAASGAEGESNEFRFWQQFQRVLFGGRGGEAKKVSGKTGNESI
jgi:hypothetical protein